MKQRRCLIVVSLLILVVILAISCSKDPVSTDEGPSDAFIQKLIAYLGAYGGSTKGAGSGGEPESTGSYLMSYVESVYVDTIDEHGEHLIGFFYYDDGGTPWPDISDDLWGFKGIKIYKDNEDTINVPPDSITDRIWLEIHVPHDDRRIISTGKNITEGHHNFGDSAYIYLEKVDAVGGKQSGKGMFFDVESGQEFHIWFGLDHKGTPDYWDDNTAWMEFELTDDVNEQVYLVHMDYESWDTSQLTGHGGSGWIRGGDANGALIATIDFDSTGWGWLTIVPTGQKFRIYVG
ncbi:MAG: hypothetical protein E3J87_01810 [Candidatus Cloacimonadota bacterium]|nr:MAG: hypothetical protein E3J87_01810 [Candidatus Cloacimonadota bacterium]